MRTIRSLFSLTPHQLVTETRRLIAVRAANTADLLEHLAEIDSRRLFVEAAYSSMQAFCVGELHMSEDSADKWLQALRAIERCPALLDAIAEGRLHLSAVNLIASRLTSDNAGELIALASRRSCAEIRARLTERDRVSTPAPDLLSQTVANPRCEADSNQVMSSPRDHEVPAEPITSAPPPPAPRVLTFTVPAELAVAYREALALAPYDVAHDPARAFAHMLAAWRAKLEKRRCGAGARQPSRPTRTDGRHVPGHVRDQVWRRDGGQCTYTSNAGRRCERREQLELDHVTPIARGGASTPDNLRLRCRAHNQLEAERAFGRPFMEAKRDAARAARERARAAREHARATCERGRAARDAARADRERQRAAEAARRAAANEVVPALRSLGLGANEARAVAMRIDLPPDAPLEQRVLTAIRTLAPRRSHVLA